MTLEDGPNKYSGIEPEDVRRVLSEFPGRRFTNRNEIRRS